MAEPDARDAPQLVPIGHTRHKRAVIVVRRLPAANARHHRPYLPGFYDVRRGAAAYAPIVATFGALAVPAITVLFTFPTDPVRAATPLIAMAAGLLTLAMLGSFAGSIGMAAIGAERRLTPNLPPAIMLVAIPAALSMIAALAAFEVLSAIYLPHSKVLFIGITGAAGAYGALVIAFAIADSWHSAPQNLDERAAWLATQWIKTQQQAYRRTYLVAAFGSLPAAAGLALRLAGVRLPETLTSIALIIGIGLALSMIGSVLGLLRTSHPLEGPPRGLRMYEAIGSTLIVSGYTFALMMFLP
jgi:hypothetical protein